MSIKMISVLMAFAATAAVAGAQTPQPGLNGKPRTVNCYLLITGKSTVKLTGAALSNDEARKALVTDCFEKYPGPKETFCPTLEKARAVICYTTP